MSEQTMMGVDQTIRIADPGDLSFVLSLGKKFSNEIGFIPREATRWYTINGGVTIGLENGEPAGFVLGRARYRWRPEMCPITQAAVCMDAQRRHLGMALVESIVRRATERGQVAVQCCCAEGLDANEFWAAAGFLRICDLRRANTRNRLIHVWRRPLSIELPKWFYDAPPVAGHRAAKAVVNTLVDPDEV